MTKKKKDEMVKAPSKIAEAIDNLVKNPAPELTERQRRIINFTLRGFTQTAIAKVEEVSQPYINKEIKKIREIHKAQGRDIDQELVVGETVSIYQEVERQAWALYFEHKTDKPSAANKALDTVMASRDKTSKLLMDLGILNRKAVEHDHNIKVAPFMEKFDNMRDEAKQAELKNIIDVSFNELEEPEPPQLVADLEVEGELEDADDE